MLVKMKMPAKTKSKVSRAKPSKKLKNYKVSIIGVSHLVSPKVAEKRVEKISTETFSHPHHIQVHKFLRKDKLKERRFRVAVFGSARIQKGDKVYKEVYNLAKRIGSKGYDIITGGGPGLMEAANEGHMKGDKAEVAESMGLLIKLPWENKANDGVEEEETFNKFAPRLETFLDLLSVAVITKGGLGTVLELSYMWQYAQVKKVRPFPIILVGPAWRKLMTWFKKYLLDKDLMSNSDFSNIFIAKNTKEAMKLVEKAHKVYLETPDSNKPILKSDLYQN